VIFVIQNIYGNTIYAVTIVEHYIYNSLYIVFYIRHAVMLYVQTVWKGLAMPEDCFETIKHCVDVTHLKMKIILYFALSINFAVEQFFIYYSHR
jgi:hypothetical protein